MGGGQPASAIGGNAEKCGSLGFRLPSEKATDFRGGSAIHCKPAPRAAAGAHSVVPDGQGHTAGRTCVSDWGGSRETPVSWGRRGSVWTVTAGCAHSGGPAGPAQPVLAAARGSGGVSRTQGGLGGHLPPREGRQASARRRGLGLGAGVEPSVLWRKGQRTQRH